MPIQLSLDPAQGIRLERLIEKLLVSRPRIGSSRYGDGSVVLDGFDIESEPADTIRILRVMLDDLRKPR